MTKKLSYLMFQQYLLILSSFHTSSFRSEFLIEYSKCTKQMEYDTLYMSHLFHYYFLNAYFRPTSKLAVHSGCFGSNLQVMNLVKMFFIMFLTVLVVESMNGLIKGLVRNPSEETSRKCQIHSKIAHIDCENIDFTSKAA